MKIKHSTIYLNIKNYDRNFLGKTYASEGIWNFYIKLNSKREEFSIKKIFFISVDFFSV